MFFYMNILHINISIFLGFITDILTINGKILFLKLLVFFISTLTQQTLTTLEIMSGPHHDPEAVGLGWQMWELSHNRQVIDDQWLMVCVFGINKHKCTTPQSAALVRPGSGASANKSLGIEWEFTM